MQFCAEPYQVTNNDYSQPLFSADDVSACAVDVLRSCCHIEATNVYQAVLTAIMASAT